MRIEVSESVQEKFDELSPEQREKVLRDIETAIELAWIEDPGQPL